MQVAVILPTHNPHRGRLARTLAGLRAQTLPAADWELVVVDNASSPALGHADLADGPAHSRLVAEAALGLTAARRAGLAATRALLVVFVDDDNVLAPDYLAQVVTLFAAHPRLGAAGGASRPEFEQEPPAWVREFDGLLACRDLGPAPLLGRGGPPPAGSRRDYPLFAPIGAGMALRREAVAPWFTATSTGPAPTDRRGSDLTSGGDNDIILAVLEAGWDVAYRPELNLTHLIPAGRTTRAYLARLNRAIACSWVQVLHRHDACPWPTVPAWTVPLRQARAWFVHRAWSSDAAFVRWQGACGHFAGLARLGSAP